MKLKASAIPYDSGAYKSGRIQTRDGESTRVSIIADGTVDHAVWNELTAASPELADNFVPSLHDPRFHNGGKAGGGDEFGTAWSKGKDQDGYYSQLGETDGAHQRVYAYPARIKTITPNFTHTIEGNVNFKELDTTSVTETLEMTLPAGAVFQKKV